MPERPADQAAREAALDTTRSLIVQAPAGSGKTDLLTRRFLKLLAEVDEPEEILAITFTRAAAAEMRTRILADLEVAARRPVSEREDDERVQLAREALAQSERRRWNLLDQPQRLAVETIDSLSLRIAADRPLLAGLGGRLQPTQQAQPLYALAAQRTFQQLGAPDAGLSEALAHLLDLRDNRLDDCEALIAKMLATRDQWQHVLPLSRDMTEDDWAEARTNLEAPFRRAIAHAVEELHRLFSAEPILANELLALANYACANDNQDVAALAGIFELSPSFSIDHWKCIASLVLTKGSEWRKTVNANDGFPPEKSGPEAKQRKASMIKLLDQYRQRPDLHAGLSAVRNLPSACYSDTQWQTLRHFLTVLRRAIAELRLAFAEQNEVDFTEISLAAIEVLRSAPDRAPGIAALARHLLIDEFQDTSRRQLDLANQLIRAWDLSEHRTVFLVGDPMQSIYMFRQAEVDIFSDVRTHGIGPADNRITCSPVELSVNFRSHSGLTTPINDFFAAIAADEPPPGSSAVPFVRAVASDPKFHPSSAHIHAQVIGSPIINATPDDTLEARRNEAQNIVDILERHLPAIRAARAEHREYRVAVLVRARPHLAHLVPLLRERAIPFRAVEIESLSDRQELLDLRSLSRALLHPMDRVSWLAILRAPWCGLTLDDLHRLTGSDARDARDLPTLELIERNQHLLSSDGRQRLARTAAILHRALDLRWRQSDSPSFASWIERTWRTLGGPASLDAAAQENAQVFFSLLDAVAPDGLAPLTPAFDATLNRLFAQPDPSESDRCGIQLMTIHKAKGLGFEVVIVPGLDRQPNKDDQPLICSLERRNPFDPSIDEFLVAPIPLKGDDSDSIYKWVRAQRKLRFDEERKRLFYVACTRARRELYLLGTAKLSSNGLGCGSPGSLLQAAWHALREEFEAAAAQPAAVQPALPDNVIPFPAPLPEPGILPALAAAAASRYPRRLPLGYEPPLPAPGVLQASADLVSSSQPPEFLRPQGSREARVIGSAVHTLLQRLGSRLAHLAPDRLRLHAESLLRAAALTGQALTTATDAVARLLSACAADPVCQWILAAHPEEQSEAAWSGFTASRLRTLRADRVFRAGPEPLVSGLDFLWIIDYKTGSIPAAAFAGGRAAFLAAERAVYAPQLQAYGRALRALHGPETPLRLALYYPALSALDFWDPAA